MVRVSVKGYLVPFLDSVGAELGTDDHTEIVNHLLREVKRNSASTGSQHLILSSQELPSNDDNALADSLLDLMPA